MFDELIAAIHERKIILFVGSGVSAQLGLPDWNGLITHLANELGYDKDVFSSLADNITLAEFYRLKKNNKIGSLRSWMDVNWHRPEVDIRTSRIYKLIVELGFRLIYTTNYDRWLEKAFEAHGRKVKKVVNVSDIAMADGDVEIVKFHGDFDDDSSIVLSESDYFNRIDFEFALDIKFRADALGKSILFIGYSLRDLNVRLLLYKLWRMWERASCRDERPCSYIFIGRPNEVHEAVLSQWGIRPLIEEAEDPSNGLEQFLVELKDRLG